MSEDAATTTRPDAPQSMSLEGECAPQASNGSTELTLREPDQAKATRDQGQTASTTSASARSASRGHPTDTETTTDASRPSEDPADATGDDERRPDEPTEPPDKPEGMRWRGSEQRVGEVELRVSRASTEGVEAAGDDGDEERRPGKPDEPPDRPQVESTEPADIQVEPGGETDAERKGSATLESADADTDEEAVGMHRDVQDEAERSRTRRGDPTEGERPSALAHGRSLMAADENGQRNETVNDDVPMGPPEPPPPPDKPANRQNEPPSVELEGERKLAASSDNARTSDEADVSGASGSVEDARKRPKKLWNASERQRKRSEQGEENSPDGAPEYPYDSGGETAIPGGVHDAQEHPRDVSSKCADETDAPGRDTSPGGRLDLPEESRAVEVDWSRGNVVDGGELDGIGRGRDGNGDDVDKYAPGRVRGSGDPGGEQEATGCVERDWKRETVVEGAGYDGRWCRMDGATSAARRDSKRVETDALAEYQASQHEQRQDRKSVV